jgi:hypothetical protein
MAMYSSRRTNSLAGHADFASSQCALPHGTMDKKTNANGEGTSRVLPDLTLCDFNRVPETENILQ